MELSGGFVVAAGGVDGGVEGQGGAGGSGGGRWGGMERLWRYAQVREYLGVSHSWVKRMVGENRIPHRKYGRLIRFVPSEIRGWRPPPSNPVGN